MRFQSFEMGVLVLQFLGLRAVAGRHQHLSPATGRIGIHCVLKSGQCLPDLLHCLLQMRFFIVQRFDAPTKLVELIVCRRIGKRSLQLRLYIKNCVVRAGGGCSSLLFKSKFVSSVKLPISSGSASIGLCTNPKSKAASSCQCKPASFA